MLFVGIYLGSRCSQELSSALSLIAMSGNGFKPKRGKSSNPTN